MYNLFIRNNVLSYQLPLSIKVKKKNAIVCLILSRVYSPSNEVPNNGIEASQH